MVKWQQKYDKILTFIMRQLRMMFYKCFSQHNNNNNNNNNLILFELFSIFWNL